MSWCPLIKDNCHGSDCILYDNFPLKSSDTNCLLTWAAISLGYIPKLVQKTDDEDKDTTVD